MLIKIYSFIVLFGFLFGGIYYVYDEYQSTQKRMEELNARHAQYESALKNTQGVVEELEQQNEIMQKRTLELQTKLKQAEEYQDDLRNKLQDHDLTKLSTKKPTMIETRINDATSTIFKELETITFDSSSMVK